MYSKEEQSENRKKWIHALRSGEYKQTVNTLHNDLGFCCLGVACDIYAKENNIDNFWYTSHNEIMRKTIDDKIVSSTVAIYIPKLAGSDCNSLPLEVQNWLGLRSDIGFFSDPVIMEEELYSKVYSSLAEMNDVNTLDFSTIADFIESLPAGLLNE